MKKMLLMFIMFIMLIPLISCQKLDETTFSPIDLKSEYAVDPIGIDTDSPRFTWVLPANSDVRKQGAYQVLVGSNSLELIKRKSLVWDSGKIASDHLNLQTNIQT